VAGKKSSIADEVVEEHSRAANERCYNTVGENGHRHRGSLYRHGSANNANYRQNEDKRVYHEKYVEEVADCIARDLLHPIRFHSTCKKYFYLVEW